MLADGGATDIVCSLMPNVTQHWYLLETIDAMGAFVLPEFAK